MTLGVILAGGQARRMGGGDKGRLMLGGRTLLTRVIDRLGPQVGRIILNANGDAARFSDTGLSVVPDSVAGFPGPLAGVLAGMEYAADLGMTEIVTVAADTPFFPSDIVQHLRKGAGEGGLCLAATSEGGRLWPQPTFGLWPVNLKEDLRAALRNGLRKVLDWTDRHDGALVAFDDPASFFNVNTPEDLERAQDML